jgi:hypothetical protein
MQAHITSLMQNKNSGNIIKGVATIAVIGLGWHFIGSPLYTLATDFNREVLHPAATPVQTQTLTPVSNPAVDVGSKVVVTSGKIVFESRKALQAYRTGTRKLSAMVADGSAFQLDHYIRATVVSIEGTDVQIVQRSDAGATGENWWIDLADAQ